LNAASSLFTIGSTASRNAFKPALLSPVAKEPFAAPAPVLHRAAARHSTVLCKHFILRISLCEKMVLLMCFAQMDAESGGADCAAPHRAQSASRADSDMLAAHKACLHKGSAVGATLTYNVLQHRSRFFV